MRNSSRWEALWVLQLGDILRRVKKTTKECYSLGYQHWKNLEINKRRAVCHKQTKSLTPTLHYKNLPTSTNARQHKKPSVQFMPPEPPWIHAGGFTPPTHLDPPWWGMGEWTGGSYRLAGWIRLAPKSRQKVQISWIGIFQKF